MGIIHSLFRLVCVAAVCVSMVSVAAADTFGTGTDAFAIDFVTIAADTNPTDGYGIVENDYRMGTLEITNGQWDAFRTFLGLPVTGDPAGAYDEGPTFAGAAIPATGVSWYEAAQFVNWLNTSTGHPAAYAFTGTQGESDYALDVWPAGQADGGTNLFRHKDAFYYLPTEDEWVKAAYWNGAEIQLYATKPGEDLHEGDGVSGTGWRYDGVGPDPESPWNVGSGSEELNGTYDMMGNVFELMEDSWGYPDDGPNSYRAVRGASYGQVGLGLRSSLRLWLEPETEGFNVGFRVASDVPEPASAALFALGSLALIRRKRNQ